MHAVDVRVPVRLDLSGGTLDIWPVHLALAEPGVTVNVALDLPARVRIRPRPAGDVGITLLSRDLQQQADYPDLAALDQALAQGRCPLPLLGQAVAHVAPAEGLQLETEAGSPSGAGLGGSSALLAAILGGLRASRGEALDLRDLQRLAQDIETRLLRAPTGYQDYFPPLFGGLLALEGRPGGLEVEQLAVPLDALARRLRLVYTGEPHVSGLTNWGVLRAFFDREPQTVEALERLARISRAQREAFRRGALDEALGLAVEDGEVRRRMAPGVSTPEIERLDHETHALGALGTKICGAGGGGCVLIVLPEDKPPAARVDRWLGAQRLQVLPVRLVATGLSCQNR